MQQESIRVNVILICSTFVSQFLTCGFSTTIGIFYVEFLEEFQYSSGVTSWVGAINYAVLNLIGPVASWVTNRYGCHVCLCLGGIISVIGLITTSFSPNLFMIFISLGFVTGAGFGLVFCACTFVINLNITKWRALSTGISMSGIGLGTTVFPLLSNFLISKYHWRGALLIVSSLVMHVCLAAMFLWMAQHMIKPQNSMIKIIRLKESEIEENTEYQCEICDIKEQKDTEKENQSEKQKFLSKENNLPRITKGKACDTDNCSQNISTIPMYWALQINTVLYCFGQSVMYTHVAAFAKVSGQSLIEASSHISAIGISSLCGRILLGLFSQHPSVDTELLYCASYFIAGIATVCYSVWKNYVFMLMCMIILGFCFGAYGPLLTEVTFKAVTHKHFTRAYGYILSFSALGTFLGAPCAGWMFDITKEYEYSFYLGGCFFMISVVPILICKRVSFLKNKIKR